MTQKGKIIVTEAAESRNTRIMTSAGTGLFAYCWQEVTRPGGHEPWDNELEIVLSEECVDIEVLHRREVYEAAREGRYTRTPSPPRPSGIKLGGGIEAERMRIYLVVGLTPECGVFLSDGSELMISAFKYRFDCWEDYAMHSIRLRVHGDSYELTKYQPVSGRPSLLMGLGGLNVEERRRAEEVLCRG